MKKERASVIDPPKPTPLPPSPPNPEFVDPAEEAKTEMHEAKLKKTVSFKEEKPAPENIQFPIPAQEILTSPVKMIVSSKRS